MSNTIHPANRIRTPEACARFMAALAPIDRAMFDSETKWGVGRLERLVSGATLAAYKRGWDAYRVALDDGDGEALEQIGPRMATALVFMDSEATAAGHKPLAPDTWEAPMADGTVLVLVRTAAEASAVIRASHAPAGVAYETTIPPDLAVTVRHQHEGRALTVWTMAEVARLIERHGSVVSDGKQPEVVNGMKWEGTPAPSGVHREEGMAADFARSGYPLEAPLTTDEGAPAKVPVFSF